MAALTDLAGCTVVVSCLPTSKEVRAAAKGLGPLLCDGHDAMWIDCTSGEPAATRSIYADHLKVHRHSLCRVPLVPCVPHVERHTVPLIRYQHYMEISTTVPHSPAGVLLVD